MAMNDSMRAAAMSLVLAAPMAPAVAQVPPPPIAAQPADPAFEAARAAFEALPEADRKAVQDALVWTGDHQGVVDGGFGRRTREALLAFQRRGEPGADGVLNPARLKALLAAGRKAKEAAKFAMMQDVTGARVGVPQLLLPQVSATKTSARYASKDARVTLDTALIANPEMDLPQLFERLKAESSTRKVTYKLQRPDFVVVAGETQGRKFYTRFAKGLDEARQPVLRGFTFYVPVDRADLDKMTIAIANAFEPFPNAKPTQAAGAAGIGGDVAAKPAASGLTSPGGVAVTPPPRPSERRSATAFAVTPGRWLTVLPKDCASPSIGGQPARVLAEQATSGLALMEGKGGAQATPAASVAPTAGMEVVALGFAREESGAASLVAASGSMGVRSGGALALSAGLQPGMDGAAVFDRQGRLVGFAKMAQPQKLVAGVAPLAAHELALAASGWELAAGAGARPADAPAAQAAPKRASELTNAYRSNLAMVACGG